MFETTSHMLRPSSCSPTVPLRCCPSSRSFTMWKKEILIMSTWPSSFSSSLQKMMPSIAPSTRWWVDTHFNTQCSHWHSNPQLPAIAEIIVNYSPFRSHFFLFLILSGIEEHHVVHREVIDRNFTWQFAHPRGHPHYPVQYDPDKGKLYIYANTLCVSANMCIQKSSAVGISICPNSHLLHKYYPYTAFVMMELKVCVCFLG